MPEKLSLFNHLANVLTGWMECVAEADFPTPSLGLSLGVEAVTKESRRRTVTAAADCSHRTHAARPAAWRP
jgi:hypothetical protein